MEKNEIKSYQILIRILKENQCISFVKKHMSSALKTKVMSNLSYENLCSLTLPYLLGANDDDLFMFFTSSAQGIKSASQFHLYILQMCLPYIKQFIHDNKLEKVIADNLLSNHTLHASKNLNEY